MNEPKGKRGRPLGEPRRPLTILVNEKNRKELVKRVSKSEGMSDITNKALDAYFREARL